MTLKQTFSGGIRDVPAGLVVFLVALPLCLGIALASDAPLVSGLVAGIVGVCVCATSAVAVSTTTDVAVRVSVKVDANGTVCVGVGVRLAYVVGVLVFVAEGEGVRDVVGVAVSIAREPTHVEACVSLFV